MTFLKLICCAGLFVFLSCASVQKQGSTLVSEGIPNGIEGIVVTAKQSEGCEVLIRYMENGKEKFLIPIELPDNFKVGGTKVSFQFHLSRIRQIDCNIGQPAVIDAIKKI